MPVAQKSERKEDDFPWRVMAVINLAVLANAIAITSLFPFVAFMIVDLGRVDSINGSGAYAGFIAGAFMTGRMSASVPWGLIADKWGRKTVLLISMSIIFGTSILFGLARSFEVAVLARFLMGFGNAGGTIKTVAAELVAKPLQPRVMAYMSGCWNIGMVLGPILGGLLARPALQYPRLFCGIELCNKGTT